MYSITVLFFFKLEEIPLLHLITSDNIARKTAFTSRDKPGLSHRPLRGNLPIPEGFNRKQDQIHQAGHY